ncbi:ead/Ea22-like family protein [Enterobacter asburiae]|uniref:ead/Ea22-like family protein n=1 Tax=Enterobacter asburiae TaxID=61645 RepID=UPI001F1BB212|nr:ead/Ea22-like family protein [Enterobacter asburiae]
MSNIDKRALREAAEKAGSDKWQAKKINGDFYVIRNGSYEKQYGITSYQPIAEIEHKPVRDYVAAANPSAVLALLDELEAKDRRIEEEIGRANREHHRGFMMACGHLKEHLNVHYADAAEMEIAALRKRINELESAAAGKGETS